MSDHTNHPTAASDDAANAHATADRPQKTKLTYALEMAARGFAVFPLQENTKVPLLGSNGHLDATTDPM